jgi:hypothetical protein
LSDPAVVSDEAAAFLFPKASAMTDRANIDDGIPAFLKLSPEQRAAAWLRNPPREAPALGRETTETERAYRASLEAERAARRARDAIRFKALRARAAAEKAERQAIKQSVKQRNR